MPATSSEPPNDNSRGKIAAIGVIVALLGVGFWLMHLLGGAAAIQDCIASGRTNCAPIAAQQ